MDNSAFTISFCTVSMNRLHHLKKTLPQNISDNRFYVNLEFVILDYNSTDGLWEWMLGNMDQQMRTGLVKFYRTETPNYFNRSHSRNMAFKKAAGDIICNLDADNYTGRDFATYINNFFMNNNQAFLTPDFTERDVMGRLCVRKTDFEKAGGFDERLQGYGYDDMDIYKRLEANRIDHRFIPKNSGFLKAITHNHRDRYCNEFIGRNIRKIYISYLKPHISEIVFLYKNGTYERGKILDNELINAKRRIKGAEDNEIVLSGEWELGCWEEKDATLYLNRAGARKALMLPVGDDFQAGKNIFYEVSDNHTFDQLIINKTEIDNRLKCSFHEDYNNRPAVNSTGYGNGELFQILPK